MTLTPTKLRSNLYKVLDHVIKTGQPVTIERNGQLIYLSAAKKKSRLANLKKRDCIVGDPEDLVHMDWSKEWKPFI